MKKIVAAILAALLLLTCLPALAETPAFTFRGGMTWGMTPEQVIAIEGATPYATEAYSHHITKVVFHNRAVSAYNCTITYWFVDGGLAMSEIVLEDSWNHLEYKTPQTVTDLSNALSTVYGTAITEDTLNTVPAADYQDWSADWEALLAGKSTGAFSFKINYDKVYSGWWPVSGTAIVVAGHDEALYLHYMNYAIDWDNAINEPAPAVTPVPNTTGL